MSCSIRKAENCWCRAWCGNPSPGTLSVDNTLALSSYDQQRMALNNRLPPKAVPETKKGRPDQPVGYLHGSRRHLEQSDH